MRKELERTRIRAQKNAADLLGILERMREDEETDLESLHLKSNELVDTIDSEWAALVLLALWDSRRDSEDEVRPHVKSALELLVQNPLQGNSRSLKALASLISACWLTHESNSRELAPIWASDTQVHEVHISITGANLPTTIDARSLVMGLSHTIHSVAQVVALERNPADLFANDRFPHLSRLPATGEGRAIWLALYLRLSLIVHLFRPTSEPHLEPISEGFSTQIYNQIGDSTVLGYPEIRSLLLSHDGEIAAHPVVESAGSYWTSPYLLMDSLAPWLLQEIQRTTLRERVISQPFEDNVVQLLRDYGFKAGPVNERGTWTTQEGAEHLHCNEPIPGQIDVLAVRDDGIFALECKSIFSMGAIRNIAEKLGPDSHDWRGKLRRKRDWVIKALQRRVDLSMVIVEGISTYTSDHEMEADIPIITMDMLADFLETAGQTKTEVEAT